MGAHSGDGLIDGRADTSSGEARLADDFLLDACTKGIPVTVGAFQSDDICDLGLSPRAGNMQFPALTMDEAAFDRNLHAMLRYAGRHHALLAPHGKTPMTPKLARRLVAAGCWGISVANIQQMAVMLRTGIENIILANEVGGAKSAGQLARLAAANPGSNIFVFVDSIAAVEAFSASLVSESTLRFLVEVGAPGGRNGLRAVKDIEAVIAKIVKIFGAARLGGAASYEGVVLSTDVDGSKRAVDDLLDMTATTFDLVRAARGEGELVLSVGGSAAFDLVAQRLGPIARDRSDVRFVMRAGTFLFHDHGMYQRFMAAIDERGGPDGDGGDVSAEAMFVPALRLWAEVLSRPEPDLAIAGFGMRDVSHDQGLPKVVTRWRDGAPVAANPDDAVSVVKLNDQHAFLRLSARSDIAVGDVLELEIFHPCTCLDKWRVFYGLDQNGVVVNAYRTCF